MNLFSYNFTTLSKKSFYSIFLPLITISFILVATSLSFIKKSHNQEHIQDFEQQVTLELKDLDDTLQHEAMHLTTILESMTQTPHLAQMIEASDKKLLLNTFASLYKTMNATSHITHLYFLDKDLRTILRVHNPQRDGDTIDRYTAHQAQWREQLSYGLELGVFGNITLRVVLPIKYENRVIGYIELGKELETLLYVVRQHYAHDTMLLLDKTLLDKENFLLSMQKEGRSINWEVSNSYVLSYATFQIFKEDFTTLVSNSDAIKHVIKDNKDFLATTRALHDASGKEVGKLIFVKEITSLLYADKIFFTSISLFALFGFAIFIVFIYIILQYGEKSIKAKTEDLEKSQRRVKELEKLSRTITWEVDNNGLYTYVSESIFPILGYIPQDIINKKYFYDLHPEQGREDFKVAAFKNFKTKQSFVNLLNYVVHANGSIHSMLTNAMPFFDKNGELLGYQGTDKDVTLELESDKQTMQQDALFQKIINTIPQRVFWKDLNLHYSGCNQIFAEDAGFTSPKDLLGKDDYEMGWAKEAKLYRMDDRKVISSGVAKLFYEEQQTTPTGETIWLSTSKMPLIDNDGMTIGMVGIYEDITKQKNIELELHRLAYYDTLTSLANKTLLLKNMQGSLEHVAKTKEYATLIFIDLDNFKILNDTMGHEIGDILLQEVAKRLVKHFAHHATIARLGGDEFIINTLTQESSYERARAFVERLIQELLVPLKSVYQLRDIEYALTASIGITLYNDDSLSSDALMKQADLAMYRSKELGRNTFTFFEPSMELSLKEKTLLQEELLNAMQNNELVLFYQPQVDKDAKVLGAEALVRWNHPTKGLVSPALFIPLAEESEAIIKLGTIVLEKACHTLAEWATHPELKSLTLAVNISVKQFNEANFIPKVKELLLQTKINPKLLKFEITESLLVINEGMVITKMQELQELGISFSLDDFGTGYSSLTYLKKLPLDQLKIDQSFVRDITYDANDAIICQSTIAIANTMGLATIAEGVETSEQKNKLLKLGCSHFQGYLFAKPLTSKLFEEHVIKANQL